MLSALRSQAVRRLSTVSSTPLLGLLNEAQAKFGADPKVASKILSLKPLLPRGDKLSQFEPTKVTIGLIQSDELPKGLLLDCLIDDPMEGDNAWKESFQAYRAKYPSNNIRIAYNDAYKRKDLFTFGVNSPFLNKSQRFNPTVSGLPVLKRELFNDIELIEVNNLQFHNDVEVGADELQFDTEIDQGLHRSDIQLYIIAQQKMAVPGQELGTDDYPFITVINRSQEPGAHFQVADEHSLQVDLGQVRQANELLEKSIDNVDQYQSLIQSSGLSTLNYILDRETSGYRPALTLLRSLLADIHTAYIASTKTESADLNAQALREQVDDWAQSSHLELQTKVVPYMEQVIMDRFTKLYVVIWNSDELALHMADYIYDSSREVTTGYLWNSQKLHCHGSLVDSDANLNYLEGKIDGIFPTGKSTVMNDPLKQLKAEVTNDKLPVLQDAINKVLLRQAVEVPLPVFMITTVGYIFDLLTLNGASAIFVFSLALAAYRASGYIYKEVAKFKDWYLESLRVSIDKNLVYLDNRISQNVTKHSGTSQDIRKLVDKLDEQADLLDAAEQELEK